MPLPARASRPRTSRLRTLPAQPYPNLGMVLNEFAAVFATVGFADAINIYFHKGELGRKYFQACPKCLFMVSTGRWHCVVRAELCALCAGRGWTFQFHFCVRFGAILDEVASYSITNPASFGLAGRNENELCHADYGARVALGKDHRML